MTEIEKRILEIKESFAYQREKLQREEQDSIAKIILFGDDGVSDEDWTAVKTYAKYLSERKCKK